MYPIAKANLEHKIQVYLRKFVHLVLFSSRNLIHGSIKILNVS